jgi:alpha-amylase
MRPISLVIAVHDERSPGDGDAVVAELVDRALRPLLGELEACPGVRLALRLSGRLADYLEAHAPELLDKVAGLLARRQVELLAGTHDGGVLHLLPERDALAQLTRSIHWLHGRFGVRARGVILEGGAWDPDLPRLLGRAGLRYTFLDQGLLGVGGQELAKVEGWMVAERAGAALGVIPLDRRLVAMTPWAVPQDLVSELQIRARDGTSALTLGVPLESLGTDAGSLEQCWRGREPWVPLCFRLIESQSAWLKSVLPAQLVARTRPGGRVYPATGTGPEAAASTLPAEPARRFLRTHALLEGGRDPVLSRAGSWIQGPSWETVLAHHDAANRLHKHMLRVSASVLQLRKAARAAPEDAALQAAAAQALLALYRGQSAAPLHDGRGGGRTDGTLRHAAWAALAEAEHLAIVHLEREEVRIEIVDHDCDGQPEVVINTPQLQAVVRPFVGGGLAELQWWGVGNLINTLSRHEEPWYDDLSAAARLPMLVGDEVGVEAADEILIEDEDGYEEWVEDATQVARTATLPAVLPAPPRLRALDPGLEKLLVVDRHDRVAFHEHFYGPTTTLENITRGQHDEAGTFLDAPYELLRTETRPEDGAQLVFLARDGTVRHGIEQRLLRVQKTYVFRVDRPEITVRYELQNRYHDPIQSRFGVELNLNLDSVRSMKRYLKIPGHRRVWLDAIHQADEVSELALHYADLDFQLQLRVSSSVPGQGAHLVHHPVEAPRRTAKGYTVGFQGTCLIFDWPLDLWGHEPATFEITLAMAHSGDQGPH